MKAPRCHARSGEKSRCSLPPIMNHSSGSTKPTAAERPATAGPHPMLSTEMPPSATDSSWNHSGHTGTHSPVEAFFSNTTAPRCHDENHTLTQA